MSEQPFSPKPLTDEDRAIYEWQIWVPGFEEAGQERLKGASVLVSRVGGVGSVVALELAAAGVGKLVLAHAGKTKHSDLNRQLVMSYAGLGFSRVEQAEKRLLDLNPALEIEPIAENVTEENADRLVEKVDIVVDCAPMFEERLAMNRAAIQQGKPMVDCAMYDLEAQLTTIWPGKTPCLACICPEPPAIWKRQFPVFGAVSGTVACLGAMEAIKVISGLGEPLYGKMLTFDLRDVSFHKSTIKRRPDCPVCGHL